MTFAGAEYPSSRLLTGKRMHCQHGPIDLVIKADGPPTAVIAAYRKTAKAFENVLATLVGELDILRSRWNRGATPPEGPVARRMWQAAGHFGGEFFLTPMIAVAGSVADEMLSVLLTETELTRVYVNNGGDIAFWLAAGERYDVGICADPLTGSFAAKAAISAGQGIGGIATSGWRGRSHSLGIADAVTVLARNAADADAAATLIANAVDLPGSPKIARRPANELSPDSDLGDTRVTTAVEPLTPGEIDRAIAPAMETASAMVAGGQIVSVGLALQGRFSVVNLDTGTTQALAAGDAEREAQFA